MRNESAKTAGTLGGGQLLARYFERLRRFDAALEQMNVVASSCGLTLRCQDRDFTPSTTTEAVAKLARRLSREVEGS